MHLRSLFLVSVMLSASLSGCFGEQQIDDAGVEAPYEFYPEPWDRTEMNYDDSDVFARVTICLLYTSPSPRDATLSRMPSSA